MRPERRLDDDAAGRRRLDVARADRRRRIDDHRRQAVARDHRPRPAARPRPCCACRRRSPRSRASGRVSSAGGRRRASFEGRDAAGVDDALDAGAQRLLHHDARALDDWCGRSPPGRAPRAGSRRRRGTGSARPRSAAANEARSRRSPSTTSIGRVELVRGLDGADQHADREPRRASAAAMADPRKPLAPVTRTGPMSAGAGCRGVSLGWDGLRLEPSYCSQRKPDIFLLNRHSSLHASRQSDRGEVRRNDEASRPQCWSAHRLPSHARAPPDPHGCGWLSGPEGRAVSTWLAFDIGPRPSASTSRSAPAATAFMLPGPGVWLMHDHAQPAATNKGNQSWWRPYRHLYEEFLGEDGLQKDPSGHCSTSSTSMRTITRGKFPFSIQRSRNDNRELQKGLARGSAGRRSLRLPGPRRSGRASPPRPDQSQRHRPVASACPERARAAGRIEVKAGRQYAREGGV